METQAPVRPGHDPGPAPILRRQHHPTLFLKGTHRHQDHRERRPRTFQSSNELTFPSQHGQMSWALARPNLHRKSPQFQSQSHHCCRGSQTCHQAASSLRQAARASHHTGGIHLKPPTSSLRTISPGVRQPTPTLRIG